MAGTRTAPDVSGAAVSQLVSVSWIDVSGDKRSDAYRVPVAATAVQIEAFIASLQAGSNASIYNVNIASEFSSPPEASNGEAGVKSDSVADHLYFTAKSTDPDAKTKRGSFPAPEGLLFIGDTDTLDPAAAETVAMLAAWLVVLGAGWNVIHGTYTQRTEINERTPI